MKYSLKGLSEKEVLESRNIHGTNQLSEYEGDSFWSKLKQNFKDPIIIILCFALVIIFVLSLFGLTEWYEAVAIGVAVMLATFVSTYSEFKNEASFQQLQEEASRINCMVFRDGQLCKIVINEIVKGDYILLQMGDKVPADGKIIHGELKINQASLTGESEPVTKTKTTKDYVWKGNDMTDKHCLFRGSVVEDGEAIMLVDAVGDKTVYGQLAMELADSDERLSPLQVKLEGLAKLISKFGYIAALVITIAFMFNKIFIVNNFDQELINAYLSGWEVLVNDVIHVLVLAIIVVVAAVPEGLPMMIAVVLSLNMRKLLKEKVLVRKLLGIETAGSLDVLFTDKTGTITKGQFEPKAFIAGSLKFYNQYKSIPEKLRSVLHFALLENTACVISSDGRIEGGNISGRAVLEFIDKEALLDKNYPETETEKVVLFNSSRKFSATQVLTFKPVAGFESNRVTLLKGAPEVILSKCEKYIDENGNVRPIDQDNITTEYDKLAEMGLRLIAIAYSDENINEQETLPTNCTLIGAIGIRDEVRQESQSSVEKAMKAGVQVIMITGDRKGTAVAIAREIGLLKSVNEVVLTSDELNRMSDGEIEEIFSKIRVISRALPTDKSRLVRIAKKMGHVVGMTGDGVNDSAALKQADVGFAMGSGSEVSKEASDIVILDDNFSSIDNAIRYGRTIFKSIRKFIVFQLTINLAAVSLVFLGPFVGFDFPLTIIQLLWINIIMDTLAAIALGGEPALDRYMNEAPINRDAHILTKEMISSILTGSITVVTLSLVFLTFDPVQTLFLRNGELSDKVFMSAFFNFFVFIITFNSFNARTDNTNIFEHITMNKGFIRVIGLIFIVQILFTYIGGNVLRATPLLFHEWLIIFAMSVVIIPIDITRKYFRSKLSKAPTHSLFVA